MADFAFTRQDESHVSSTTTKTVPLTCHGHSRPITHLSFSALLTSPSNPSPHASTQDGQYYMISACKDNNPMLRDGLTGDWIGTFIGHKGAVWSSRVSSDAGLAATGSADFTAKVWDTFTGECLGSLEHNHIVRAVAFPGLEGRPGVLATGGMEKRLRVWDLSRITNATSTSNGTNGTANGATAADTPSYEIGSGEHQGAIKSIVWSRDPNVLTTAADDKKIRWWDLRSRSSIASYTIDALPTSCEVNSGLNGDPAGTLSVAAGKNIYFFSSTQLIKHIKTEREVSAVALNGDAKRFVTGSPADTWVHVWDYETEVQLETGKGHHGPVWTCGFSPDGKLYATGSEDGTVKLWKFGEGGYGLWR
ncbi:WD40 repeat-like protein [Teratosphaeria nubilosa]|uniref:Serine-threonine kinase receptor-associated protein n=1 Tax=Teratosphaeria nubilosa TaxID=161662 RepID=A0A6G1LDK4_9PEZI|nr:WD40 repeat-like protein [Teratosphaeria nubilosa]